MSLKFGVPKTKYPKLTVEFVSALPETSRTLLTLNVYVVAEVNGVEKIK